MVMPCACDEDGGWYCREHVMRMDEGNYVSM